MMHQIPLYVRIALEQPRRALPMSHHEDTRHTAKTKSLALLEKRPKRQGPKILEELPKEESIISIVVKRITKKRHLFFARWR